MSDIFREIDEELRRDNLLQLWARYRRYVIGVAVVALVVAGGIMAWRDHQLSERRAQSTRYAAALNLVGEGKDAEAATVFAAIAREGGGYGTLAAFEEAEFLAKSGDRKAAVAAYDRIAERGDTDPAFRDVALLLSVMQGMADINPQVTINRLAPLTAAGNPWRPTAVELTAIARLQSGDKNAALNLYKGLADDPMAPQGLRARAAEMAAALAS